jgi:hypothetical protein
MKRIDTRLNKSELELISAALTRMHVPDLTEDERKVYKNLVIRIEEDLDTLSQEEIRAKMYSEDEDGKEQLTEYGKESLIEKNTHTID